MKMKKIRELVRLLEESEIAELEISRFFSLSRVRIVKCREEGGYPSIQGVTQPPRHVETVSRPTATEGDDVSGIEAEEDADRVAHIVSPMVGTFYRALAPDAEPFVRKGREIEVGQVVCIVEAMKLMNEIESDCDGEIVEILVENGTPVQYNQPLFTVKTSA